MRRASPTWRSKASMVVAANGRESSFFCLLTWRKARKVMDRRSCSCLDNCWRKTSLMSMEERKLHQFFQSWFFCWHELGVMLLDCEESERWRKPMRRCEEVVGRF